VPVAQQSELMFFPKGGIAPSPEGRQKYLSTIWSGFIGNEKAVHRLKRIEYDALGRYNRVCGDFAIAVLGKSGCGKTEAVHRHCQANKLPTVEFSAKAIRNTHSIFTAIQSVCVAHCIPLIEAGRHDHYICPPINVFIDEVHALNPNVVQGLLKATEYQDAFLMTEEGVIVNCRNIHWIIATTDRGKLFDAFDTRFVKISLSMYTKDELACIIKVKNPDWSDEVCQLVAMYSSRIPREALAFAREMRLEYNMLPGDWVRVAKVIARDNEIDDFGISLQRLNILKMLGRGPIAAKRMPLIAGCKQEELEKFILPWLLEATEDQEPFITVTPRGYAITEQGLAELDKRGISHKGVDALALVAQ
jgi:hypothetical protein